MSTINLNLEIPDGGDIADIADINENFSKIDIFAGEKNENIEDLQAQINEKLEKDGYTGTAMDLKHLIEAVAIGEPLPAIVELERKENKGIADGYVPLNSSTLIDPIFLPSYVDEMIEGYYSEGIFYSDIAHTIIITPEINKIYIDLTNEGTNSYRWSGTEYRFVGTGQLVTITTDGLMSYLDKVKLNGIAEGATKVELSLVNGNILVNGIEFQVYRIADNEVTNVKLEQMPTMTIKGNDAVGNADPQDLTVPEVQTMIQDTTHRFVTDSEKSTWNSASAGVNIGDIIYRTSNTVPTGYLKANGALISRATYSDLFSVIGTTFGAGDGSTTFKLPDLRGEFIRGWDDGRRIDSGRILGSWQSGDLQPHKHLENSLHIKGYDGKTYSNINGSVERGTDQATRVADTGGEYYAISPYTQNSTGIETRPRNIALMAIIKY